MAIKGGVWTVVWLGLLAVFVAVAVGIAALLMPPGTVGAQAPECSDGGVVPGSVEVVSNNNLVGEASGHTIRFQLCRNSESAGRSIGNGIYLARPAEIGLLWDWFHLEHPEQAGITLKATGAGKSWDAANAIAEKSCYFGVRAEERWGRTGVYAALTGDDFNTLSPPGKNAPVTLQFDIPEAAGMLNPTFPDDYQWQVILRYDRGSYWETYTGAAVTPVAPKVTHYFDPEASIRLSSNRGQPGMRITVVGQGFPPLSQVESVHIWKVLAFMDGPASTDAQGKFRFDITIPGLDSGHYTIGVLVNGAVTTVGFTVVRAATLGVEPRSEDALRNLGDNLARVFHYYPGNKSWTFYDPEIPEVSTLEHFSDGETYWILLKSPVTGVILNRHYRYLNCAVGGDFWNVIVW